MSRERVNFYSKEGRTALLKQAKFLMISAYYEDAIKDINEHHQGIAFNEELYAQIYGFAVESVEFFASLYESEDRHYHDPQHPMVQLLDKLARGWLQEVRDDPALYALTEEDNARNPKYKAAIVDFLEKRPHKEKSKEVHKTFVLLHEALLHDGLYYIPALNQDKKTDQFKLLTRVIAQKSLRAILNQPEGFFQFGKLALNFKQGIEGIDLTVGELAALFVFPDGKGSYKADVTFNKDAEGGLYGLNEWTTAVISINKENEFRQKHGLPMLAIREVLEICAGLAATVPFGEANYMQSMANNLKAFIIKNPIIQRELGCTDEASINECVDQIVSQAARLANADVANFASTAGDLRDSDIEVAKEAGVDFDSGDPVIEFKNYMRLFAKHADITDLEKFEGADLASDEVFGQGKTSGFIRQKAMERRTFHAYTPLSDNKEYCVEVEQSNHDYFNNAEILRTWNLYDAAVTLQKIACELDKKYSRSDGAFLVARGVKHFLLDLQQPYDVGSVEVPNADTLSAMEIFATKVFSSDFWKENKHMLVGAEHVIADMEEFLREVDKEKQTKETEHQAAGKKQSLSSLYKGGDNRDVFPTI